MKNECTWSRKSLMFWKQRQSCTRYCPMFWGVTVLCSGVLLSYVLGCYCPMFWGVTVLCSGVLLSYVLGCYCPMFWGVTVLCSGVLLSYVLGCYCPIFWGVTVLCSGVLLFYVLGCHCPMFWGVTVLCSGMGQLHHSIHVFLLMFCCLFANYLLWLPQFSMFLHTGVDFWFKYDFILHRSVYTSGVKYRNKTNTDLTSQSYTLMKNV